MNPIRDAVSIPSTAIAAVRGLGELISRLPEIERAVVKASTHVQETLDEGLERVRPLQGDLRQLREDAASLERELESTRSAIEPLDARIETLTELIAQLEGALDHVLDRVPGLSAQSARERGDEVAAAAAE
jgi:chromosome segregation ATPase